VSVKHSEREVDLLAAVGIWRSYFDRFAMAAAVIISHLFRISITVCRLILMRLLPDGKTDAQKTQENQLWKVGDASRDWRKHHSPTEEQNCAKPKTEQYRLLPTV
jgi:hypothetical protein